MENLTQIYNCKPVVWYDKMHVYHKGDNRHPENPRRIDGVLKYLLPYTSSEAIILNNLEADILHENDTCVKWVYASDDKNDTTYLTEYTNTITTRVKKMIDNAYENIVTGSMCVFVLSRPPGHHHCSEKGPHGFCIQNNIWYATLQSFKHGFKRPLIFDWDVHYGDGTEREVLRSQVPVVRFISMHASGDDIYPQTGSVRYMQHPHNNKIDVINVPLEEGCGVKKYVLEFYHHVLPRIIEYNPDIILVSAGFDGHKDDPMKLMKLSEHTYYEMSMELKLRNCPVMFVLEGGYCPNTLGKCVFKTLLPWLGEMRSSM